MGSALAADEPAGSSGEDRAPALDERAPEEEPDARVGLEEIVVTARKRPESLEETPLSVTALGPAVLEDAQVRQLDEIQDLVPSMVWTTGNSGIGGNVVIRGVGKGAEDLVFDPGVGVYVDGILLSRDIGQLLPMLDIEQIEALRGPQGTLFGKNTVGGAVSIHTQKPHDSVEGRLMFGYGNFESIRTQAMVNTPIIEDKLYARFNWVSDQNDGYATNLRLRRFGERSGPARGHGLVARHTHRGAHDRRGGKLVARSPARNGPELRADRSQHRRSTRRGISVWLHDGRIACPVRALRGWNGSLRPSIGRSQYLGSRVLWRLGDDRLRARFDGLHRQLPRASGI